MKIINQDYKKGGTQKTFYELNDLQDINCLNCNSDKKSRVHTEFGNIGIVKCKNCSLMYTSPRPKNVELNYHGDKNKYYEEYKYIFNGTKPHHRDKNYIQELNIIKKFIKKGKIVDVGCNAGRFLHFAKKFGFDAFGVEPSKSLAELGTENFDLIIENCKLENSSFSKNSIDIITAIDVFEHLTNPLMFLNKSYEILKKDGILVIKIPNGNYCLTKLKIAKLFNKNTLNMDIFDSYEHVAHYSKKTFEKFINNTKFKIKKIYAPIPIHPPVWTIINDQYYLHTSPWTWDWKKVIMRKMFHFIGKIELLLRLPMYFQADILYILKKRS